jgi:hypothetical protein
LEIGINNIVEMQEYHKQISHRSNLKIIEDNMDMVTVKDRGMDWMAIDLGLVSKWEGFHQLILLEVETQEYYKHIRHLSNLKIIEVNKDTDRDSMAIDMGLVSKWEGFHQLILIEVVIISTHRWVIHHQFMVISTITMEKIRQSSQSRRGLKVWSR